MVGAAVLLVELYTLTSLECMPKVLTGYRIGTARMATILISY